MTGDKIQLGEVRRLSPVLSSRPDQQSNCSVVRCGSAQEPELPVFFSWDGLRILHDHLYSDVSVELGGVLLGDQCEDEQGRPFVLVTDSLAAQDYENSASSFTFTHNTWSQFTRELDPLVGGRRMIGWYHSHPGWGVLLSDRDRFICENFFGGALDIALVVDSQHNQFGVFHRTRGVTGRMKPASSCFVFVAGEACSQMMAHGLPAPWSFHAGPAGETVVDIV